MKRIPLPNYVNRSGENFETTQRFLESSVVVDSTQDKLQAAGIPMEQVDENVYAASDGEMHCFVIGDTGSGKTRRVIMPTIRLLAKTGESMVISDTKGELYRTTADSLRKKGYDVKVLNFRSPARGDRWNPLALIDKLYHMEDEESRDKALMMLSDLVDVLQDGITARDPYWAIASGNIFRGISLMILEHSDFGKLTFENVAILAREFYAQVRAYRDGDRDKMPTPPLISYMTRLPKGSPIFQNLSVVFINAPNTANCIMSEFEAMISLYSSHESMLDLFAESSIDVSDLGKKPTALFFILPDDTQALYPIATVFVKQIYSALVSLADDQPDGELPNRVTFLLDEFANFAKMPSIDSMLTAARSRRIRFVLVCQSMDQLTAKYQESGRETLMANCRIWVYMSCRNLPFLRRLEELVGFYASPYTGERVPLVSIGQLQHLEMGEVLVLNDRCRPMMGNLPDYSEYDFGEEGSGQIVEIPAPHEKIRRKLFDVGEIYRAMERDAARAAGKFRNMQRRRQEQERQNQKQLQRHVQEQKKEQEQDQTRGRKQEAQSLSADIRKKIRAYQKKLQESSGEAV
ncbi:MAG: type IV secretory system conjugative DNA transfer family protein [Lachnospiraceae bacterium]|nr:type IV secretory system conjugative DNA transfer family protein [Lachnospiraceae bacterium]